MTKTIALTLICAACMLATRAAWAGDPYLEWYTIRTPHFRIHFHGGLEDLAQRTATLAETLNERLGPELGYTPSEVTHVLLTDGTDDANGSATGLPYNTIRMFASAPDDMSPLNDYDDWLLELLTHEHTHVLHVDNVRGIPALINSIIGKTLLPNQNQPRWILEGLAVAMESAHTSAGRVRATLFDMYLRADVLEDNFAGLDRISHDVRRWPRGNLWYLYGGRFLAWIRELYGPDVFRAVALDYAQNPFAWGLNRSMRRATGRTYEDLYSAWHASLRRSYAAQVERIRRRGLREGARLTFRGGNASNPRFVPEACRRGPNEEVLFHRDDGESPDGLYRLVLTPRRDAAEGEPELVIRTAGGERNASFDPACGVVFDSVAPSRRRHYLNDLHRQPPDTTSARGLLGSRERWTTGGRARDPDLSPDGRRVVYVTNRAGTSTLRIADVRPEGGITRGRTLVPSAPFEQAYTPRFSPDGTRVAYSAWTRGGYRDIRVVDVKTGRFVALTHDRSLDQQPSWSPDGKRLFFTSDRTGVANVYAYDFETRALSQVTNVINGAYMPEVSRDGATLLYVGYTHEGFDLFSMPLVPARFLEALPPPADRGEVPGEPPRVRWPVVSYNPLPTLRPRALDFEYGPGTFGDALTITLSGHDIVGFHSLTGRLVFQTELDSLTGSVNYNYSRLPFSLDLSAFRDVFPRQAVLLNDRARRVHEQVTGVTSAVNYRMLGEFDSQLLSFSYTVTDRDPTIPIGDRLDPFSRVPTNLFEGLLASVGVGYGYDNSYRSAWAISAERGFSLSFAGEFASRETGSEETLASFRARATGYLLMPWARHHVLAATLGAGAATGTYPARGFFYTGGFADQDPVEDFQSGVRQGGFVLRGYAPGRFVGRKFNLLNVEYRFPLLYADRGISTLPVFFQGLSGLLFTDVGGAYNRLDPDDPLADQNASAGAELWLSLVFGYFVSGTLRFGVAKGFSEEALPGLQTYLVLASSF